VHYLKLFFLLVLFITGKAHAYPEFIGYGYAACLTCHYNGNGGGPLTDYGRSLWSVEIASRALYPKAMTDEQIGAQSGFLGSVPLPYWIRPHAKYRGIDVQTDPGGSKSNKFKYYQMQTDFGLAAQNRSGRFSAVFTFGRLVPPEQLGLGKQGLDHLAAREYYLRAKFFKSWWLYVGLMEKVFGLRNIDHTSYQRFYQGFGVTNNTSHGIGESEGVILQKVAKTWEMSGNVFAGNPNDSSAFKQKGASVMGEFEIGENKRLGASLFSAQSANLKKKMGAIHYRQALNKGSALMLEWGLIEDTPKFSPKMTGSYNLIQAIVLLTRGYSLKTTIEHYNSDFKASSADNWKWSFGLLMFPLPRVELRAEAVNFRIVSGQSATEDTWALQGQVHVSL
jgi:hypothetical protein